MEINTTVINTAPLQEAIDEYIKEYAKDAEKFFLSQAGLLAKELMDRTPPYRNLAGGGGSSKDDQKAGMEAVRRDLVRAVTPSEEMFTDSFRSTSFEKLIKRKKVDVLREVIKNFKGMEQWDVRRFDPSLHTDKRRRGNRYRVKQQDIMTPDDTKWRSYLRKVQKSVGYMKAGWGVTLAALNKSMPAWVRKHTSYAKGRVEIKMEDQKQSILMENSTPSIGRHKSSFDYAITYRATKINNEISKHIEYLLKKKGLQK